MAVAAFLTRLLPLSISSFPYNNDSLTECSIASQILSSGVLDSVSEAPWSLSHSLATPGLNVLLAFVAGCLGSTPLAVAQWIGAVLSALTISTIFLVGVKISGSLSGGITASFGAVMMGTFIFTTGSVWKEALGISLMVLVLYAYLQREELRFRVLALIGLMLLPFVHHLVAVITLLFTGYMLVWSWYYAISNIGPRKRHFLDLLLVAVPSAEAAIYYSLVSFDRYAMFSTPTRLLLFLVSFTVFSVVAMYVLSINKHSKLSFAPLLFVIVFVLVLLDYFGMLFPYSPSSDWYFILVIASLFLVSLAWYGTELSLDENHMYRAIQVGLLVSPLTIVTLGVSEGFTLSANQIFYRTFDFLDIFIFLGIGFAIAHLSIKRRYLSRFLAVGLIISLVVSFPFAYYTQPLLGVRHDTQSYEVDAIDWVVRVNNVPCVVSDERISYIAVSMFGVAKASYLPSDMLKNVSLASLYILDNNLFEDSWTTTGVNAYPFGLIVLPQQNYTWIKEAGNVVYIGGPTEDHIVNVLGSRLGETAIYGNTH